MSNCCNSNTAICPCGSFTHPSVIFNPPGQSIIAYRVGDYTAFRYALLQSLPGETELSSTQNGVTTPIWVPSGHGDLALQMMEWWAYLADILTFYNQRVATQAYLRTADLPASVNGLVRLLGYRPKPGIGATGSLAALANTPLPFTLPQGFAIQSKPGPGQQPQVFELDADTTVGVPPTAQVSPAQMLGAVTTQTQTLTQSQTSVAIATGSTSATLTLAGTSSAVKKGDQVLVLPTGSPANPSDFALATVMQVTPASDPTLGAITNIKVTWVASSNSGISTHWQLYKGGQSTQVWQYPANDNKVVRPVGSANTPTTIDLESIVRGIMPNDPVLFQASSPATFQLFAVQSTTEVVWYANPVGGDPSAAPANPVIAIPIPHTSVTLSTGLTFVAPPNGAAPTDTQNDRPSFFLWHSWTEVDDLIAVPSATLPASDPAASASSAGVPLYLSGTINFPPPSGPNATIPVLVVDSVGNGATGVANSPTSVVLDNTAPLLIPPLQTYFNILSVSCGKTVSNEVVGSGDATLAGQDFMLQNAPVTYLQDPASVSGDNYSSTVHVYVNGLKWTEVQSFYDQPYDAQVYITREDDSGNTHVVFGDGVYGARLPTGTNNVVANYRYGSGAAAPAANTLTVVLKPSPGLRSIVNPVAVGGGADPDVPSAIRQLAPKSVLTFGRAVSADDFQVIAAQAPGVTRAAAAFGFDPIEQRPRVTVWVGDDQNALTAATAAIAAAADPNRLPAILQATQVPITLSLSIVVGPKYQQATVQAAVYAALLDPDTGLLGVNAVGIGQVFFDSQIYAACLAVPGVSVVRNLAFAIAQPRFRYQYIVKTPARAAAAPTNQCGLNRHDPGAGSYYFLADDGTSLTINPGGPVSQFPDHYDMYYADKLWNLLPAVYRALDTDNFNSNGPLREMVNRIGAQAAILRRSIDRMWEDQSIETCDDWLIPYIGDLVATNLVANLNARAARLDVANTIDYRRRKGTLGLLEELAFNITGWNARVVEFFRRLGRTRHNLDPQIGQSPSPGDAVDVLQQAEGIVGPLTRTRIGGTADLRNVYGATQVGSAFDEFFHTADFRFGQGMVGWHNIPRLGVFLWRLQSFGLAPTTPVAVAGCPNWFTFDPTGRDVPLFAAARESDQYGDNWVSPAQEQLPGPITQALYDANEKASAADVAVKLYPNSLQVLPTPVPATDDDYVPANEVTIRPELGRFMYCGSSPPGSPPGGLWTTYYYGFSSEIGAGPYDRRLVRPAPPTPPGQPSMTGGSAALAAPGAFPPSGTLTINDSLTYDGASKVSISGAAIAIYAANEQRPLIRLPAGRHGMAGEWVIEGDGESSLVLDGLFISGGDVVICGTFQSITITCCTLDPGSSADSALSSPPGDFAISADERPLAPTRLWIEASVETLTIGYSIAGPIQTRNGGKIQTLCISNSIVQAIPGSAATQSQSPPSPPAGAADAALLLGDGEVCLSRCTVLGQVIVHQLRASESILAGMATVDDTQHGCVRFTAWEQGSVLPAKYESVQVPAQAEIFTSTDFGQPGYCQLLATADLAIEPDPTAATQNTISAGSQDGSEMGAFAGAQNPIKQRGLLIKFQEYMPAGLIPVIVYMT